MKVPTTDPKTYLESCSAMLGIGYNFGFCSVTTTLTVTQ